MTARDRFTATYRAVIELNNIKALIASDGDDWKPPGVHAPGVSDPTASRAIRNVDYWGVKLEELRKRETELEDFIGVTLQLIEAVRAGLGHDYADLLDQRYIDGFAWRDVTLRGEVVPRSTGKRKIAIAFDWIDSVGVSHLLRGEYEV